MNPNKKDDKYEKHKRHQDKSRIIVPRFEKKFNINLANKLEKYGLRYLNNLKKFSIFSIAFILIYEIALNMKDKKN